MFYDLPKSAGRKRIKNPLKQRALNKNAIMSLQETVFSVYLFQESVLVNFLLYLLGKYYLLRT